MEFPDNEEALKAMKYKDVQKVAKKVGVKGTLPKVQLIEKIMEVQLDVEPCKISKIICSGKLLTYKALIIGEKANISYPYSS